LNQEDLYELMDGMPVKMLKMMTGASSQHDLVVVNLIPLLRKQLRGSRCRPTTDDIALRAAIRTVRRPDVAVECGPLVQDTYEAHEPKFVAEVLSLSTTDIDRFRKLEEYKCRPTLAYILLLETRAPKATLYRRSDDGEWRTERFEGLETAIALPQIGAELALREVYEDLFG
jgi:Uma2 family endonuclease